jgi:predicted metalloendopeptidase
MAESRRSPKEFQIRTVVNAVLGESIWNLATYYKKMDGKDVHAQYPVRVNGQVSLISDWYELFDVREGQKLYVAPEKRFYIW